MIAGEQWSLRSLQALHADLREEIDLHHRTSGPNWAEGHRARQRLVAIARLLEDAGAPLALPTDGQYAALVDTYRYRKEDVVAFANDRQHGA